MELTVPHFVCLAAGDNEQALWGQLLVIVILAAGAGIYTFAKSRTKHVRRMAQDRTIETLIAPLAPQSRQAGVEELVPQPKKRDLKSGMELLAKDFLVGVVEGTAVVGPLDIAMRSMCFNELVRRGDLWAVSSQAVRVYILDEGGLFGKSIQCQALAELADRTQKGIRQSPQSPDFAAPPDGDHAPAAHVVDNR
jgi:hypothetical protein